jgi:hypothetical protein
VACSVDGDRTGLDRSSLDVVTSDAVSLQAVVGATAISAIALDRLVAVGVSLGLGSEVSCIDICLLALARAVSLLDKRLVGLERSLELRDGDVVEEDTFAELPVGDGESLLAISGLPGRISAITRLKTGRVSLLDSLRGGRDELVVKQVVVHGQPDGRHQREPLVSLRIVEHASGVSKGNGVCHVDGDGVTVSQRDSRGELEGGRPGVTKRNDSVKT